MHLHASYVAAVECVLALRVALEEYVGFVHGDHVTYSSECNTLLLSMQENDPHKSPSQRIPPILLDTYAKGLSDFSFSFFFFCD